MKVVASYAFRVEQFGMGFEAHPNITRNSQLVTRNKMRQCRILLLKGLKALEHQSQILDIPCADTCPGTLFETSICHIYPF